MDKEQVRFWRTLGVAIRLSAETTDRHIEARVVLDRIGGSVIATLRAMDLITEAEEELALEAESIEESLGASTAATESKEE